MTFALQRETQQLGTDSSGKFVHSTDWHSRAANFAARDSSLGVRLHMASGTSRCMKGGSLPCEQDYVAGEPKPGTRALA